MFFIKHQQKFVPAEEKRPSLDLVLVPSSSVGPSVRLLVSLVVSRWLSTVKTRGQRSVCPSGSGLALMVVVVTRLLQRRGPHSALLQRHKAGSAPGSALGSAHLAGHHCDRALPALQVDLDALLQTPEREC